MPIERSRRPIAAARITAAAHRLLDASTLCAIATVSSIGRAHVNTAYFAWSGELDLVWLSDSHARHSRNVRANGTVAIAVFDSNQIWGKPDRGIQLFGSARELPPKAAREAERIYAERFPECGQSDFDLYRLYHFRPRRLKLFDERALGGGVFITARVSSDGGVAWERTDIYRERESWRRSSNGSSPSSSCSIDVIHDEKCSARQTRRRHVDEYDSSPVSRPVAYQSAIASASTRTSAIARFRPFAPVAGTIWAASPARKSRPYCIGSTTKLRMPVMPFSSTGPSCSVQPSSAVRACSSCQIRSSGHSSSGSSGRHCT